MKTPVLILIGVCISLIGFGQVDGLFGSNEINEEAEKNAIIESLTAETENFYKRDYEGIIKYFVHADYAFHSWNNADGTFNATVGWPAISEKYKNYIKDNPVQEGTSNDTKVERRNMIFKFFTSNLAFVTWDQYNSDAENKTYHLSKETRIMEKQNGLWKIANMTAFWDYKNLISNPDKQ
jgi:hypothetical protein